MEFSRIIEYTNKAHIMDLKVGQSKDWKFGLITRHITRVGEDEYQIDDTSDGWSSAFVTGEELKQIIKGELQLLDLNWE